ncbi:hypothetical protein Nepgr_022698 [Nepenthes gracilis]|uniref:Uncharacterized protein n=1 Tax=Nepenthes gracilis TaxID=150966 RepID=A0AAD3T328_NEPGR|nr:hypothetical protein Nepgr_022698 [Nepenthes gracilis]
METLVAVAQHRNQYYGRSKPHTTGKFRSSPSRGFKDINCRAFESGTGLLPIPWKACATTLPYQTLSPSKSPTLGADPNGSANPKIEDGKTLKRNISSPIPISMNGSGKKERAFNGSPSPFSELWAGPTYSNSPPPSSLPIPKFSLKPKRTVSLELPVLESHIDFHAIAKSAPTSPTRGLTHLPDYFAFNDYSATKNLRRILNLDIVDE